VGALLGAIEADPDATPGQARTADQDHGDGHAILLREEAKLAGEPQAALGAMLDVPIGGGQERVGTIRQADRAYPTAAKPASSRPDSFSGRISWMNGVWKYTSKTLTTCVFTAAFAFRWRKTHFIS
jgi:hypothetical protein